MITLNSAGQITENSPPTILGTALKEIFVVKHFFFLITIMIVFFTGCTVNNNTGLILVQNKTFGPLNNVKIGDKNISGFTASGATSTYWYYEPVKGKLSVENLSVRTNQSNWTLNLKPGYWVYITAEYDSQAGNDIVTISVYGSSSVQAPLSEWRED